MGLFSRMMGGGSAQLQRASGVPSGGMIPPLGSIASAAGMMISQATAMSVSTVYAAVNVLAHDVARCTPTLYVRKKDGSRAPVTDHPVAKLLRRPNRVQTWFEFIRDIVVAHKLRGNGYAVGLQARNGDPTELLLVNPDAVMMLEAVDGQLFYNVNRLGLFQIAVLQDFPVSIPAEHVFHLRGMSFNMLVGASTIGLGRDAIGLSMGLSQQQSRWVANGARPSVVLETPRRLDDKAAERLKTSWNQFSAGLENVGKTAVLEEGIQAKPIQLTSVDLQFIEQSQMTVQDICRFLGVPPRKVFQPDTTRGSTVIQEDQAYVNASISPLLEMIEQKFGQFFDLDDENLELDLNEDALLRADPLTRYNLGRIGKLSGLVSTNEWRRAERMPPVDGGDEVMQPVNMAVLGSDMSGQSPDGAGRPPAGHMPDPGVPTDGPAAADDAAPEG